MQQVRKTALACYDGFTEEQKNKAFAIFEAMDSDGSGPISRKEYKEFFGRLNRTSFEELDTDGNGRLDFEDFITLFYILMTSEVESTKQVPLPVTQDQYPKHFQSTTSDVEWVSLMQRKPSQSDGVETTASQSVIEPVSRSERYREVVMKAIEDFNTVLAFGSTLTSVATTADPAPLCDPSISVCSFIVL